MHAYIKPIILSEFHSVEIIKTPFGLFGVLVLVFGIVQSKISLEDRLLSDVDVKNLLQRLAVLEESLLVEKERNDRLEKTVNVLATNLEQTKRMFEEKCTGPRKLSLFGESEGIARKTQKRKTDVSMIIPLQHQEFCRRCIQQIQKVYYFFFFYTLNI